jgi:hypothetical protein
MKAKNHLKGFAEFTNTQVNEMASELTKLGVPKHLMQFIHKLEGKKFAPRAGQKQINPKTGKADIEFHTRLAPAASKKGPWPEREDAPLAHDIQVNGTKTGKRAIQHYLEEIVPKDKDTDIRLILITPNQDLVHYITRKTGKTTPEQRERKYGESNRDRSRELSRFDREAPVSEKTGMYIRVVTIDGDSGEPISTWNGTIGQMIQQGEIDDSSVLYIMEKEDRVREKRGKRKEYREVSDDKFLEYFTANFEKIASAMLGKGAERAKSEIQDIAKDIDFTKANIDYHGNIKLPHESAKRIQELQKVIKSVSFDINSLKPKLNNFLELAKKEGEYEPAGDDYYLRGRANLSQMIEIHTMPVVASMFLQFVSFGKVTKQFHTDDPFKELGLEDLF